MTLKSSWTKQININLCMLVVATALLLVLARDAARLPIYPDEVAYKIFLERFFINGGFKQSVTPYCPDGFLAGVPLPLMPAAASWTVLNHLGGGWVSYRLLPLLAFGSTILLLIANALRKQDASVWGSILLVGAGPAIFGLVILRPEILIIFAGVVLFLLSRAIARSVQFVHIAALSFVSLFVFSLVAYVHPKAIYLVPLVLLGVGMGVLAIKRVPLRWGFAATAGLMLASITTSALNLHRLQFLSCPQVPSIQLAMGIQSIDPGDAFTNFPRFKTELEIAVGSDLVGKTLQRLMFSTSYQVSYLPNVDRPGLTFCIANIFILAALALGCISTLLKFGLLAWLPAPAHIKGELWLIAALAIGFAVPIIFNLVRNWYDISFLVAAIMVVTALLQPISLAGAPYCRIAIVAKKIAAILALGSAVLSIAVTQQLIVPEFKAGFVGPGLSLQTDRTAVALAVTQLQETTGAGAFDPIIVDDLTYDALSQHRIVVPVTYLGLGHVTEDIIKKALATNDVHVSITACLTAGVLAALRWKKVATLEGVSHLQLCAFSDRSTAD